MKYVKATQNSTNTTDKTVGYLDRSQWVGRWLVRERKEKEEDKASPLFSFSQILALLLVINNSILNILPITNKSLWLGICICTWFYGTGILSHVLLPVTSHIEMIYLTY